MSAGMTQVNYIDVGEMRRRWRRAQWTTGAALFVPGLLLEAAYLALYPWLAGRTVAAQQDVVRRSWESFVPGLQRLYTTIDWTAYVEPLYHWPALLRGHLFPLLVVLALAMLLLIVASGVGERGDRVLGDDVYVGRPVFVVVFLLTCIFALTMLCSPIYAQPFARDLFQSALNGRLVVTYHLNPYLVHGTPAALTHDSLQQVLQGLSLKQASYPSSPFGPVWTDIGILIALIPHNDIVGTILSFRVLNVIVHLVNTLLLWSLLTTLRPWQRIGGTILYAWNPLILLLGISLPHQEMLVIMLILLALMSIRHNATTLSWVVILLTALVDLSTLLLVPLFLFCLLRQTRFMGCLWRLSWAAGMVVVTMLVVVMAYLPYWWGWGFAGIWQNVRQVFVQGTALNSLNAVVLALPLHLSGTFLRYLQPAYWSLGLLALLGCYLLIALLLADTVELTLLYGGWLLLLWYALSPVYWPWFLLVPWIFVVCAESRKLTWCMLLMTCGALLSWYCWQWPQPWLLQGLLVVGIPFLLWGWFLFFLSLWRMLFWRDRADDDEDDEAYGDALILGDDDNEVNETTQRVQMPEDVPTRPATRTMGMRSGRRPQRHVNLHPNRL